MNRRDRFLVTAALLALAFGPGLGACASSTDEMGKPPVEGEPSETAAPSTPAAVEIRLVSEPITTEGRLALRNLSSSIDAQRVSVEQRPELSALRVALIDSLLARARYAGRYSDFDEVASLLDTAPATSADIELARVRFLSAIHRFDDAAELLATLEVSPKERRSRVIIESVALNRNLDEALRAAEAAVEEDPSYESFVNLASVEAVLGRFEDADAHFIDGLEAYGDVSPFPYAYVAFQRGVMWAEMADRRDLALPLYREALRRLPSYAVATVHLAELLATDGQDEAAAIALLRAINEETEDPEPRGLLASLVPGTPEATALIADATARYDALLSRYPLAFADHGSEFFADPLAGNDAPRAVELAVRNLDNRENARAFVVGIDAYLANDDEAGACALARRATPFLAVHPVLAGEVESLPCR